MKIINLGVKTIKYGVGVEVIMNIIYNKNRWK